MMIPPARKRSRLSIRDHAEYLDFNGPIACMGRPQVAVSIYSICSAAREKVFGIQHTMGIDANLAWSMGPCCPVTLMPKQ